MTFRHSVFFETCEEADSTEARINRLIAPDDIYQSNNGESRLIEVRFFTHQKLDRYEQTDLVSHACTYALNCEDW